MWANLVHLSRNMWADRDATEWLGPEWETVSARPHLRFDTPLWNDLLIRMSEAGMNAVVIDLGDGVKYESHPEIAVRRAWTRKRLRRELEKCRKLGLEPIPKLNFSTAHDTWLGPYARMVSTDTYYAVCRDLIAETIDLFDRPRLFHLGMDEETARHQSHYEYVVLRQFDLWWRDLYFFIEQVEKGGVRPWVWSDYIWNHPDEFLKKMPRSVLQSNWYYGGRFNQKINYVQAYKQLEQGRYEQVPTGSNWSRPENFGKTVTYCRKHIAPKRLVGFLQSTWKPTQEPYRQRHMDAIDLVGRAIARWK
jgi:hypothetical protein